jgi:hypothetical protein
MAPFSQYRSISFFQKLMRVFLNAFAMRSALNLMRRFMQELVSALLTPALNFLI